MNTFLNINPLSLTLYVFLAIIFFSLLILIFYGDTEDKTYQKIIGGIAVFIVALISRNWFVIFTSLFIGGLIIASEKFLKSLAAILKTDSDTMPETLAALNEAVDVSFASEEEVEVEKNKEDAEIPKLHSQDRLSFEQRDKVEEKIINILTEKYGTHFTGNLKLENQYGQILVDGAIHNSEDFGKLNIENVLGLAEIRYISNPENNLSFEFSVKRVLERIRYLFISKQILIIFCAKNITKVRSEELVLRLKSLYSQKSGEGDVTFGFINIKENLDIEVISLPGLKPHVL